MIPIVNQILSWEKELEIREQKSRKPWHDDVFPLDNLASRPESRRSTFAWLPRFTRQQPCDSPRAACD